MQILKVVQALAMQILEADPLLEKKENKILKKAIDKKFSGKIEI